MSYVDVPEILARAELLAGLFSGTTATVSRAQAASRLAATAHGERDAVTTSEAVRPSLRAAADAAAALSAAPAGPARPALLAPPIVASPAASRPDPPAMCAPLWQPGGPAARGRREGSSDRPRRGQPRSWIVTTCAGCAVVVTDEALQAIAPLLLDALRVRDASLFAAFASALDRCDGSLDLTVALARAGAALAWRAATRIVVARLAAGTESDRGGGAYAAARLLSAPITG